MTLTIPLICYSVDGQGVVDLSVASPIYINNILKLICPLTNMLVALKNSGSTFHYKNHKIDEVVEVSSGVQHYGEIYDITYNPQYSNPRINVAVFDVNNCDSINLIVNVNELYYVNSENSLSKNPSVSISLSKSPFGISNSIVIDPPTSSSSTTTQSLFTGGLILYNNLIYLNLFRNYFFPVSCCDGTDLTLRATNFYVNSLYLIGTIYALSKSTTSSPTIYDVFQYNPSINSSANSSSTNSSSTNPSSFSNMKLYQYYDHIKIYCQNDNLFADIKTSENSFETVTVEYADKNVKNAYLSFFISSQITFSS